MCAGGDVERGQGLEQELEGRVVLARLVGQPEGSAIYFGVDFNVSPAPAAGGIREQALLFRAEDPCGYARCFREAGHKFLAVWRMSAR